MWSKEYLEYVAPQTKTNEMYVATLKVQDWLNLGYTDRQVFLSWNAGRPIAISGVNRHGVAYDSGKYADRGLSYLQ